MLNKIKSGIGSILGFIGISVMFALIFVQFTFGDIEKSDFLLGMISSMLAMCLAHLLIYKEQ